MEKKFDDGLDREDSGSRGNSTPKRNESESADSPFARDKRPRIRRTTDQLNDRAPRSPFERKEGPSDERRPYPPRPSDDERRSPYNRPSEDRRPYAPRPGQDDRPYERRDDRRPYERRPDNREPNRYGQPDDTRRRSYNPNFDEENRLRRPAPRQDYNRSESSEDDRRYNTYRGDRPREGYDNQNHPQRSYGDRPPRSYDDRPRYNNNRDDRSGGYRDNRDNRYPPRGEGRPYPPRDDRDFRGGNNNRKPFRPNDNRGKKPADPFKTPKGGYDSEYKPKVYPAYSAASIVEPIRLNKFISMSGVCSRREADEFIRDGRVTVNGEAVTEMGVKISPTDQICFDGEALQGEKRVYILMNKPKGFVTTVEDPNADRTVMDIVKNACKERVYPVGRLDKNSLGVLLITNDGELTKRLTHPGHEKKKVYQVAVDRAIPAEELEKLLQGVELEDGMAVADEVEYLDETRRDIGITIHTGRNRIVRRMFDALGYHVQKLDRVYFAGLTKKNLRRGAWRYLTPKEVAMLKTGKYE